MLGCWGQMREHAIHVRSTRSLVPAYQSFDPSRRGDTASRTWRVLAGFRATLGPSWGGSLVMVSSVKLLAVLALCLFFR